MRLDVELIEEREKELEKARKYLKTQFVGIDDIIDKFIHSVKLWYVIPEIQSRPLIINLWGITGVGKTDLVRKFVKAIRFTDKFTEIQMDSKDGNATIEDYLESTFDSNETQGILLLDEIQRFRTIREDGSEVSSSKFQDLWMLLSDGIFQSNSQLKQDLIRMVLEDDYYADTPDDEDEDIPENEVTESDKKKANKKIHIQKYLTSPWEAGRLKRMLKLDEPLGDIMKWDKEKKMVLIKEKINSPETYEGKKYTKLLIIVSGNLDEAFHMANNVDDSDSDADVYHEYSKSIDIINIKGALTRRFKPEQIARLGNIHLIYPIPSKAAYRTIIKQKVNSIVKIVKDNNGIDIEVDKSLLKVIYDNGVFPTQGVRPVISTVSSILENSLPKFLFEFLKAELDITKESISLKYSDGHITSIIDKKEVKYEIPTVLDEIKDKQTDNNKALVSVHEAGHAMLYALFFNTVPTQIVATTANNDSEGFIGIHPHMGAKSQFLDTVRVTLGGRIAEELIFGKDIISAGAGSDLAYATVVIGEYIKAWAMSDENIGTYSPLPKSDGTMKVSLEKHDIQMENMLQELYAETVIKVGENMNFLMDVTKELMKKSALTQLEFQKIAKKHMDKPIVIVNAGNELEVDYKKMLDKKLKGK